MYIFSSLRDIRSGFSGSCEVRNQLTICCSVSRSCLQCGEGFITPSSPPGSPPPDTAALLNVAAGTTCLAGVLFMLPLALSVGVSSRPMCATDGV